MCTSYICTYINFPTGKSKDKGKLVQSEMALQRFGLQPTGSVLTTDSDQK